MLRSFLLLTGAAALLTACGTITLKPAVNLGVNTQDLNSTVTVTKLITPADPATGAPQQVSWDVGDAGTATFTFTSKPGGQAGYITGYRYKTDTVNGVDRVVAPVQGLNLYFSSGYTCTRLRTGTVQTCDLLADSDIQAANGTPITMNIDLASAMADVVMSTDATVDRRTTLVFTGVSASNEAFEVEVAGIRTRAQKIERYQ
ncbi:hypothetical protein [Deinococcus soli (ex Cha et al. 2016)]|uniref:Lipoprotein n=2 Tax=Deinococcus soli (ex Cha et al. 2016) TaxID=1309411 RepID=A0AAE4BKX9_9DEIO|nr:hypothetical protein [Deinococcus soli (ex Cha et al. 2016)]MDR6218298.1 hypothetical protein [Deinococcus soli (ex Cha et al. 2016)]MDR6329038.1 hypothetical protein [Deinococcus soli (ex Cha et al. 2016)]MDR6751311.1 hypothetical protein [Deinococcus soli (ex Cha et al. 2016)]